MVDIYNDIMETASNWFNKLKNSEIFQKTKESIKSHKEINGMINDLEKNDNLKPYVDLVKNAGNNNSSKFEMRGNMYSLDYEKRKKIVYFIMGGLFIRHLFKTNYFRRFLFHYIVLSALFCRENFDLKNYKIKPWEKDDSKPIEKKSL
jgi:hypothetical protein